MKTPHPNIQKILDGFAADSCCRKGCSFCCSEPAYADILEIEAMLETLTPDQIDEVKERTREWLAKVEPSGMLDTRWDDDFKGEKYAFPYRRLNAACPFLKDGTCMCYETRPIACRTFFAKGDASLCDKEEDRKRQLVLDPPLSLMALIQLDFAQQAKAAMFQMDHIGVLLGCLLLGRNTPSASYLCETVDMKRMLDTVSAVAAHEQETGTILKTSDVQEPKSQ